MGTQHDIDFNRLARAIKCWGKDLGFQQVGIAGIELDAMGMPDVLARPAQFFGVLGIEAMLGVDRASSQGFDDYSVGDWSLRWNFALPAAWRATLDARREPFRYSVPLIDNRIEVEADLVVLATGMVPVAAVQAPTGAMAPAMPPMTMFCGVFGFRYRV